MFMQIGQEWFKMKKIFTFLIGLMLVLSLVQAAPPIPAPVKIVVQVNGQNINYADTKVTNKATGEILTKTEVGSLYIQNGIGLFDLSEFTQGYESAGRTYAGDEIEVVACNVHSDCTKTFRITNTNPRIVSFYITTGNAYVCWDNSVVPNPSNCPVQPQPEIAESEITINSVDEDTASVEANYGQEIEVTLRNNKLPKLLDTEIKFNGETYDIKEELSFKGIVQTSLDDEDFGLNPYLIIGENAISYKYVFDDQIDLTEITEEEPLEITFLGQEIKIIEASSNEIKVRSGIEKTLLEGNSVEVSGKEVKIETIGEDSVSVNVDGVSQIVAEGNSREINGINILIEDILYKSYGGSAVEIMIGTETDKTIKNGDDFELFIKDDETYAWVINLPNSIGITNKEEYKSVDEDEDFKPITIGESLSLPNNYVKINFKEVSKPDESKLNIRVKDNYLLVKGDSDDTFSTSSDEYAKVYVNSVGIYDEDNVLISNDKVRIGDSDTYLELGSVKIGKLEIKLDMSDILYNGISFATKDTSFLDYFGIIFKDPESAVEDKEGFEVIVPEERPEATITFTIGGLEIEVPIIVPKPEEPIVEPTTPTITPTEPIVTPEPTKPTIIEKVTIKCEDGTEVTDVSKCPIVEPEGISFLTALFASLVALVLGILGAKYKWAAPLMKAWQTRISKAKTEEAKKKAIVGAVKTAKTVLTKDKEGKYK